MRRPFQRCVYRGGSACSCWDIALWVRRPTSSLLEAEKSVDKGLKRPLWCPAPSTTASWGKTGFLNYLICKDNPRVHAGIKVNLTLCGCNFLYLYPIGTKCTSNASYFHAGDGQNSLLSLLRFGGGKLATPPPPTTLIPHIEVGFKWMWTQLVTPNKMAPIFVDLCAGLVVLLPRQIRRFHHGFFSSAVLDWSLRSCLRVRHLWRQQIADNRRYLRRSFLLWTSSLRSQISLSKRR